MRFRLLLLQLLSVRPPAFLKPSQAPSAKWANNLYPHRYPFTSGWWDATTVKNAVPQDTNAVTRIRTHTLVTQFEYSPQYSQQWGWCSLSSPYHGWIMMISTLCFLYNAVTTGPSPWFFKTGAFWTQIVVCVLRVSSTYFYLGLEDLVTVQSGAFYMVSFLSFV